ncbi:MAG: sugar phosphate isomerase/epimerase family protein [Pseudomonadota bacterium]
MTRDLRLSFSTNAYVRRSVFDAVEHIASLGYDGVELLADTPHLYAESVTEDDLQRLGDLLQSKGIEAANINANTAVGFYGREFWEPLFEPSIAAPDPSLRRRRIEYSKKCIDMAHRLGSDCVSLTSGRMVPGVLPKESMGLLRDSLDELLDHAAPMSVRIGIEYEPGLLIESCEELAALIDDVESPLLGANLDLGHSHVLGEDPESVIRRLGDRIFHIHIEDIKDRKHYHLVPGHGDMDFPRLFRLLRRQGYGGFVTVELYTYPHRPEQVASEALEYLKRI